MFGPKRFVQACINVLALAGTVPVLAAEQEPYLSAGGYACLVCHGQVAHSGGRAMSP